MARDGLRKYNHDAPSNTEAVTIGITVTITIVMLTVIFTIIDSADRNVEGFWSNPVSAILGFLVVVFIVTIILKILLKWSMIYNVIIVATTVIFFLLFVFNLNNIAGSINSSISHLGDGGKLIIVFCALIISLIASAIKED